MLRVLFAHNRYQQAGGEDRVLAEEMRMLEKRGHPVALFSVDNDAIQGTVKQLQAGLNSIYSSRTAGQIDRLIQEFRPHILHVHNFQPTLSPSVFFAARRRHVPVVYTLHNYRLVCAAANLLRDGHVCELCIESRSFLPGVRHSCYRGSKLGSAVVGFNMAFHSAIGTWTSRVDRYIALTQSSEEILTRFRVPKELVRIKPNFVADTPVGAGLGGFALFAGRLSPEKGIATLIEADRSGLLRMPVHVAGDGPMMPALQSAAALPGSQLRILGSRGREEMQALMRDAAVLLVPSIWHEVMPMTVMEAMATGLPVIASRMGGLPEIIVENVTGFLVPPNDATALTEAVNRFCEKSPVMQQLRVASRLRYEEYFSEPVNYRRLMSIYAELTEPRSSEA